MAYGNQIGQSFGGTDPSPPVRAPAVEASLSQLRENIQTLGKLADELEGRFGAVLHATPPSAVGKDTKPTMNCGLAQTITELGDSAYGIVTRLRSIVERCEL